MRASLIGLLALIAFSMIGFPGGAALAQEPPAAPKSAVAPTGPTTGALVDINSANLEQLGGLPGIDDAYGQKIIDRRPYLKKSDLLRKKVVPAATYRMIADKIIAKRATKTKRSGNPGN